MYNIEKIKLVTDEYKAYKITVSLDEREKLFNPELWPEGIVVDKFKFRSKICFFHFFYLLLVLTFIISFKFDLRICTFNCCSLKKNIDLVRELTSKCSDIIFLQEILVMKDRFGSLLFLMNTMMYRNRSFLF